MWGELWFDMLLHHKMWTSCAIEEQFGSTYYIIFLANWLTEVYSQALIHPTTFTPAILDIIIASNCMLVRMTYSHLAFNKPWMVSICYLLFCVHKLKFQPGSTGSSYLGLYISSLAGIHKTSVKKKYTQIFSILKLH